MEFIISRLIFVVIFLAVGVMWYTFIRNVIKGIQRSNQKVTNKRTTRSMTFQGQDQTRQPSRRNQAGTSKEVNPLQQLLRRNPLELYKLLKDNLPDHLVEEVKEIFNSPNSGRELMSFLRRKDVWPMVQKILQEETGNQPKRRSNSLHQVLEQVQPVAETMDYVDDVSESVDYFAQEDEQLQKEYDDVMSNFDDLLSEVPGGEAIELIKPENHQSSNKPFKGKVDKKWLEEAVIANIILERPKF